MVKKPTIEVTESSGRRYSKPVSGEVLPKPEPSTPLDELIRACDEGDGATLQERRAEIREGLVELRKYRDVISCARCKQTVLGRHPVCLDCFEALGRQLIAESLEELKRADQKDRTLGALRALLERKLGR